jgi:hypothetical protein
MSENIEAWISTSTNGPAYTFRTPRLFLWKPLEDITAHELALSMPVLLAVAGHGLSCAVEDAILALPEGARRHFTFQ